VRRLVLYILNTGMLIWYVRGHVFDLTAHVLSSQRNHRRHLDRGMQSHFFVAIRTDDCLRSMRRRRPWSSSPSTSPCPRVRSSCTEPSAAPAHRLAAFFNSLLASLNIRQLAFSVSDAGPREHARPAADRDVKGDFSSDLAVRVETTTIHKIDECLVPAPRCGRRWKPERATWTPAEPRAREDVESTEGSTEAWSPEDAAPIHAV
jgi:hypothetical protein